MNIKINCKQKFIPLKYGHMNMGGKSNNGETIKTNNLYFEYNNKPWIPIMGEFHYSRYPSELWETEILKIKASGINTISSYLIWIHHEENKGEYNFKGDRDVRLFVELCKKHNMKFVARLGPWVHAEVRNGGFPDWLIKKCSLAKDSKYNGGDYYHHAMYNGERFVRANKEPYLTHTKEIYKQYYKELKGLLFKDGGPIIGIQLDNELVDDSEHLKTLKDIAIEIGFDVPIYTVTGWSWDGIVRFPENEVIPLFGGYPEAPWEQNTDPFEIKPSHYFFTKGRNDGTIGSDQISGAKCGLKEDILDDYIYASCEIGPGVQNTWHRRPIIKPYDLYTVSLVMLGKGNNLPGYYVYHGGRNPDGELGLYNETRDTFYPNDCPVISYDFQAPIGEYGFIKPSYNYYKLFHMFVNSYGEHLATTQPMYPNITPKGARDKQTPRVIARMDENGSGYLFINTNNRNYDVDSIENLKVEIETKKEIFNIPEQGVYIPEKTSCIFPINQKIGKANLKYATVQPITQIENNNEISLFYFAVNGINAEFAFENISIKNCKGDIITKDNVKYIKNIPTSLDVAIEFEQDNKTYKLFILNFTDALKTYKMKVKDKETLFISTGNLMQDENNQIFVYGETIEQEFIVKTYPNLDTNFITNQKDGEFNISEIPVENISIGINLEKQKNKIFEDNKFVKYIFSKAKDCPEYKLTVDKDIFEKAYDYKVLLDCQCDVFQVYHNQKLVADFFNSGDLIELGLRRFKEIIEKGESLTIKMSPYSEDKLIFTERKIYKDIIKIDVFGVQTTNFKKLI